MPDRVAQPEEKKNFLPAVMDENCTSCAGSPVCELHCPPAGLKPYRVWVDNKILLKNDGLKGSRRTRFPKNFSLS